MRTYNIICVSQIRPGGIVPHVAGKTTYKYRYSEFRAASTAARLRKSSREPAADAHENRKHNNNTYSCCCTQCVPWGTKRIKNTHTQIRMRSESQPIIWRRRVIHRVVMWVRPRGPSRSGPNRLYIRVPYNLLENRLCVSLLPQSVLTVCTTLYKQCSILSSLLSML